jgi:hypothetical protein
MLPDTRHPAFTISHAPLPASLSSVQGPGRGAPVLFSALHTAGRADLLGPVRRQHRTVPGDPSQDELAARRVVGPARSDATLPLAEVGHHSSTRTEVTCADDTTCVCALSGHITDAERAVMNGITTQAARASTALSWVLVVAALAALVLLMRWTG